MQTNPADEQNKIIRWSESPCNQSGRKGKSLWRKGFAEEPSLESTSAGTLWQFQSTLKTILFCSAYAVQNTIWRFRDCLGR